MVLIKSIIQSLPTYTLSAMSPPKGTLDLIEKYFGSFFWGTSANKRKYHWSVWKNLCLPKDEGGVGIRSMHDISSTLAMKRWWRFRTNNSLWSSYLRSKYCIRSHSVKKNGPRGLACLETFDAN